MAEPITRRPQTPTTIVVMGVSGCGKSEIGRRLAACLGWQYVEGDDAHSPENIAKMAAGVALDDADRLGWLLQLQAQIARARREGRAVVLTCSALKRRYRDLLRAGDPSLACIHLVGNRSLIEARMRSRHSHFMPVALLESQLRDLEPLAADERGAWLDIRLDPQSLVAQAVSLLGFADNVDDANDGDAGMP